jgi:hypothetical protein
MTDAEWEDAERMETRRATAAMMGGLWIDDWGVYCITSRNGSRYYNEKGEEVSLVDHFKQRKKR